MCRLVIALPIILLEASIALSTTPAELRVLWQTIEDDLQVRQPLAQQEILKNLDKARVILKDTQSKFWANLTSEAQPFWAELRKIEENESSNPNASICILPGAGQLYSLNETVMEIHFEGMVNLEANIELDIQNIWNSVNITQKEVMSLKYHVNACPENDNVKAGVIEEDVLKFHQRALAFLDKTVQKSSELIELDLAKALASVAFNSDQYKGAYNEILDDVRQCLADQN